MMASIMKHKPIQQWKMYKDGKPEKKCCPRCGLGTFIAEHKDRIHCGKCGYAEIKREKHG